MDRIVHSFMTKHQLIHEGETILVAVSGGPDSMALLHFLNSEKEKWNGRVIAVSVDHGLRGEESQQDLAYVKQMCKEWNVEFVGTSVDVHSYKEQTGHGTQSSARHLRYTFFEKVMAEYGADVLALGHHGDDQTETMLMQITRNVSPHVIQGIPVQRPFSKGRMIRPFLCVSKEQILLYNTTHGIRPREDASNQETDYTRNAFRKHVVPFLKEQNPHLHTHIQTMSERMREDQSYIKKEAEEVLNHVRFSSDMKKSAQFSINVFKSFPRALQRSAFHLILNYLYVDQTEELSYLHEDAFFGLLKEQKPNAELHFPRGLRVVRAYDEMTLSFEQNTHNHTFNQVLSIGEPTELPNGDRITAEWTDEKENEGKYTYVCDSHHVKLPLIVRTRKRGDRLQLRGMKGSKKVKDIFIDQKIPAYLRDSWPLVTDGEGKLLWVIGLKKGGVCTGEPSGSWLRLHVENKADL